MPNALNLNRPRRTSRIRSGSVFTAICALALASALMGAAAEAADDLAAPDQTVTADSQQKLQIQAD